MRDTFLIYLISIPFCIIFIIIDEIYTNIKNKKELEFDEFIDDLNRDELDDYSTVSTFIITNEQEEK
jgi:hypothetical protein